MFDRTRRNAWWQLAPGFCLLSVTLAGACVQESTDPIPGNILVGAKVEQTGVPHTMRLTDGQLSVEGDPWDTAITARFDNPQGTVTWDLGADKPIRCALIQGDNNDTYILSGSADGKTWQPLWKAGAVDGAGMRTRQTQLNGTARYLSLAAQGGDNLYSVGELAVFSECPKSWPKMSLNRIEASPSDEGTSGASSWSVSVGVLVAAAVVLVLLSRKRRPPAPATAGAPGGEPPPPP